MYNKKKRIIFFLLYFSALFCGLLHMHYATDTYGNMYGSNVEWQLAVGRYSIYILAKLFELLKISLIKWQQIFMVFSIVVLTISAELIYSSFRSKIEMKNDVLLFGVICVSLGNVFSTELYLFPEYTLYNALGVFLAIASFYVFLQKSKISYLYGLIILIFSLGFYQANIGIFIILCLTSILLDEYNSVSSYFGFVVKTLILAGGASLFNIIIKKILAQMNIAEVTARDAELDLSIVSQNLKTIMSAQKNILVYGDDLLPKYSLIFVLIFGIASLIYCIVKNKKNIKYLLFSLAYIFVCYICVYAPHLIAGSVWLSPRTITPLFVFIGCIFILVLANMRDKNIVLEKLVVIVACVFCAVNFWAVQGIIQNHIATNKIDQEYAYNVYSEILKYEDKTGNTVTQIATVNDEIPMWKNRYVEYYSYNINERAYINQWSDVSLINFVSGNIYQKIDMDEMIYDTLFKGKDWDYYCPEEQLYFENDTMYWCKY